MDLPDLASPSSTLSPPNGNSLRPPSSENASPHGRVPKKQPIPAAIPLRGSPSSKAPISPPTSPGYAGYAQRYETLLEDQRKLHDEERALWHIERRELQAKIKQLEDSLRQFYSTYDKQVDTPTRKAKSNTGSLKNPPSTSSSPGSASSNWKNTKVWHGPSSNVEPTRTFSQVLKGSMRSGNRVSSINDKSQSAMQKSFRDDQGNKQSPPSKSNSINGEDIDKNLDGIKFKASALTPESVQNIMTPQSPSPKSPSPSKASPPTIELPSPSTVAELENRLKQNAGHTPLSRHIYIDPDGTESDPTTPTPTQPEQERPPLEPNPSMVKSPSERANSYFPAPPDNDGANEDPPFKGQLGLTNDESKDQHFSAPPDNDGANEDPPLKGQLGLTNDESKDQHFLDKLDSKLMQAVHESPTVAGASQEKEDEGKEVEPSEGKSIEAPEPVVELRIKRSMNFGSEFGDPNLGKEYAEYVGYMITRSPDDKA